MRFAWHMLRKGHPISALDELVHWLALDGTRLGRKLCDYVDRKYLGDDYEDEYEDGA